MKAIRFHRTGEPGVLCLEDLAEPVAGAGQLLVQVEAAGVNYADAIRRSGGPYPVPTPLPHVCGAEVVGRVIAAGPGADTSLVGQRVVGTCDGGGYAERALVPGALAYRIDDDIDAAVAAALFIQGLTAALVLRQVGAVEPGDSVFVEGAAGGVGSLAVQLARLYGAGCVVAGAGSADKRLFCLELGADAAVDYTLPGWPGQVIEATRGRGIDLALQMSGGATAMPCIATLAPEGRMVTYGAAAGDMPVVPVGALMGGSQGVHGFYLGTYLPRRDLIARLLGEMTQWVSSKQLAVRIGGRYPLAEAARAHRDLEGRVSIGKLVLLP